MKELITFIKKSKRLIALLEEGLPRDAREDYIQSIYDLLNERERLLKDMSDLSNVLDEDIKQELVQMEEKIKKLMLEQQNVIKSDLQVLQLKKKKNNQYANPYENVSADGMFLDKKK